MKYRKTLAAVFAVAGMLFVWGAGSASAQTITSDPIQTVPGYQGCGGNQNIQTVNSTTTCANQRTFHFGAANRTVVAVSTMNPDGTASVTFTLTGGNAPANIQLRVRSHVGISLGGTTADVSGVMPIGTRGPVTLTFLYDCGQVDVKAVFTANDNDQGRISGGYFCKPTTVPTTAPTTTPGSTTPQTTTPLSSVAPTSAPNTSGGPGVSAVASVSALPATGSGPGPIAILAFGLLGGGVAITLIYLTLLRPQR